MSITTNHIFISYSRHDTEVMQRIAFFLRDRGFKVWVDNEKLVPGTTAWESAIEGALKNAYAVVVILSPEAISSEWVRREITYSDQFNKRIFPVLVQGDEESALPLRLVTRQYVDLRADEAAGLEALTKAIQFYLDEKQTLEMKRPAEIKSLTTKPRMPAAAQPGKPVWPWAAGIFAGLCVLCGLGWVGLRVLFPPTPPESAATQALIAEPTTPAMTATSHSVSTDSVSASALTGLPPTAAVPVSEVPGQFLNNVQVAKLETFDGSSPENWNIQSGKVEDGAMQIIGNKNNDGAWYSADFSENQGLLIDFRFSQRSTFLVYLNFGSFGTDQFRRFGMDVDNSTTPITDLYGPGYLSGGYSGQLSPTPDKTYTLLLAILPNGEVLDVVWDPANPAEMLKFQKQYDDTWAGLPWTLVIQAQKGTVVFDNFRVIEFGN